MKVKFADVEEDVVTREEFPIEAALATLEDEVIAVLGYGSQGPGQAQNLRDNGFNVIVGQREGTASWDKAI
ncbi:MAG: ketol-acid reductoisomerase, partial [Candidatus Aenigmarchaeota archaeon]|nr:ketol-acid reductoisomerase [Candidatus Aenigmarchaeota archaeon]